MHLVIAQWLRRCTNRAGGDARVQMLKPLTAPPKGFTGTRAHKLKQAEGMQCITIMYATCVLALHVVSLGRPNNKKFSSIQTVVCEVLSCDSSSCSNSQLAVFSYIGICDSLAHRQHPDQR